MDPLVLGVILAIIASALVSAGVAAFASASAAGHPHGAAASLRFPALLQASHDRIDLWAAQRRLDVAALVGSEIAREQLRALEGPEPAAARARAAISLRVKSLMRRDPQLRGLWFIAASGRILHTVATEPNPAVAPTAGVGRAESTHWDDARRELVVEVAYGGVRLVAAVGPGALEAELTRLPLGGAALYLVSRSGAVVARAGASDARPRHPVPAAADGADAAAVRVAEIQQPSGEAWVRAAQAHPALAWTVVTEEPVSAAAAPVARLVRRIVVVSFCVALVFGGFALLLAGRVVRALYRDAHHATGGPGEDQAGVEVRAFRALRARARETLQELRVKRREIVEANSRLVARNEELRRANAALEKLSITDELTKLPNHRFFRDSLPRELKRALRTGEPLSLVLFDIDDFKALNDRHGHAVGDAILARISEVMIEQVREIDLLARYGGEEFALLAPGTGLEGAVALAEKVRLAVAAARFSVISLEGPQSIQVTVSAGVALFRGDERSLFNDADRALYRAKAAGKDCVVVGPIRSTPRSLRAPLRTDRQAS